MIFLGPVITDNSQTVVFSIITDQLKAALGSFIDEALLLVVGIASFGSVLVSAFSTNRDPDTLINQIMRTSWPWIVLRCLGFCVVLAVYLDQGPEVLRLPDTGITVVKDIGQNVLIIYFVGLLLMPLLTEYGLMEFAGTLCRRPFKLMFKLPGRAAIDALTSIAAASAIGLLMTISQYQRGNYNAREACTIACNFSLVSIPFALLVAEVADIGHLFFSWYLSVLAACGVCAVVLSRIPPLSRVPVHNPLPATQLSETAAIKNDAATGLDGAWRLALQRAAGSPGLTLYLTNALKSFVVTATGVIGPSIAVATLASLLLFHTPVITFLAQPLAALLTLFGVFQAGSVAAGMIVGFVDQFLPTLVATRIDAELWRFVLAGLSVSQIVFMSEFGLLVLRSSLPLSFMDLALVFVLRTLITAPILIGFGMLAT